MTEIDMTDLKHTIEARYGGIAGLVQSVLAQDEHGGRTIWDRTVYVFDLAGHPKTTRARAWSYERPDNRGQFFAVQQAPPIIDPRDAVRAATVAEQRAEKTKGKCPACGGTGRIYEAFDVIPGRYPDTPIQPDCPKCNGTGQTE